MANTSYREHYEKYLEVYEELAYANGGKTVWIPTDAHDGWYVTEPVDDEESRAWKEGYPNKSRPSILPDDLSPDVERTAYTTISYADDESYKDAYYRETENGVEWLDDDSERLPDYGSLTAWALFVDIDIDDDYKKRPLPQEHKEVISDRLNLWTRAFARMAGGIEHVMSLDSGGGMYVFVPPTALSPVADRYEEDELNLIFNEVGKRMRSVTGKLDELICREDNAPTELFSADKVQNKNRQFKTIGSIHKDLNTVVYPINPEFIDIEHKPVESIEDEDVELAMDWAEEFTSDRHRECVGSVIEYLFQGQFTERDDMDIEPVEGNDWKEILDEWVEDKKDSIQTWQKAKKKRKQMSEKKLKTELTQDKEVAREALRRVNNRQLKNYIVEYLGEDLVYEKSGSEEMDFFPFWRSGSTESGRSAFYDFYEGKARFTDKADGTSRDIVYWVGLEMTYDDENYPNTNLIKSPGETLEGKDYRVAVNELRERGEDIPILVQDVEEGEQLPNWQIRNLALQLGIATQEDIVEDDGEEKLKAEVWNDTLKRLEREGIKHNRQYKRPLEVTDITKPDNHEIWNKLGHYNKEFDSREHYKEFMKKLPKYVVPFEYNGESIAGGEPKGVMGGVFDSQDDETITMTRFEPMIVESVESIDTYEDLTIETTERLDKKNIQLLQFDESKM